MTPPTRRSPSGDSSDFLKIADTTSGNTECTTPEVAVDAIECVMACSSIECPWRCPLIGGA